LTQAKVELFDKDLQIAASYFKALGHPARLAVLRYLAEARTCISGDISRELPLGRTTVNQHLKELKDLGLILGEIDGVRVNYCLNTSRLRELKDIVLTFLSAMKCCDDTNCK